MGTETSEAGRALESGRFTGNSRADPPPRDLVFGMAGHIDHGKTALVQSLTGVNTDRLPAERERGITIDLGFTALDLGTARVALVDVPGHQRFLRNMLAGATGVDLAVLVVAADDSVMPQTREHLDVLRLLHLTGGVVALTKCDLADEAWLELVESDVRSLVKGTFLEGAEIVRTSAATGQGISDLKAAMTRAAREARPRGDVGPFRLAIDRSFTLPGRGTVVTGTVASGSVAVGDELEWWRSGRSVRVRGLHQHDRAVERLGQGARAAINLVGVHHDEIGRGDTLATPGYFRPTRLLGVTLSASEDAPRALKHRGRYKVHLGTAEESATLSLLGADRLEPGESGLGELLLPRDVVAVSDQPFILREESPAATLGGGLVIRPTGRRTRRRDRAGIARLERRASPDPDVRLTAALEDQGAAIGSPLDLCRETGIPLDQVTDRLSAVAEGGEIVEVAASGRRVLRLARGVVEEGEDRVRRSLARLHERWPRQSTIRRIHLAASLPDLVGSGLADALIERLIARGEILGDAASVALASFEPKLSHSERKLKADLLKSIQDGGFSPPDVPDLIPRGGSRTALVPELLTLLADEGRIVAIAPTLYLSTESEAVLRDRVRERLQGDATMTMADLRDLLSTTRKYAVPIGEYLDRIGLTRREGDVRRLGDPSRG